MRHLATLAAVARTGSFRGAGSALGYAQSTVSEHIAALEQACGRQLVERRRGRRGAVLTHAGHRLAERAEQVVARLAAARADVAAAGSGAPALRIGLARDVAPDLLAPALARFHGARPDARLTVREAADAQHAAALVHEAAVDVGVAEQVAMPAPDAVELAREPFVVVAPQGTDLEAPVRRHDLLGRSLVAPAPVLDRLVAAGFERGRILLAADPAAVLERVGAGAGVALLPRGRAPRHDPGFSVLAQDDLLPARRIVAWRNVARRHDAPAAAFLALAAGEIDPAPQFRLLRQAA
jgi:molybdate transport repressor ModE-like protein